MIPPRTNNPVSDVFAVAGHPDLSVEELLERVAAAGDRVAATNVHGITVLMAAVLGGSVQHVQALKAFVSPLVQDLNGMTALMWSAARGPNEIVELLLTPETARQTNDDGQTALMIAAAVGDEMKLRTLLPLSDPHQVDTCGRTALMHAAMQGDAVKVKALIPVSLPNARDMDLNTALIYAAAHGDLERVQALVKVSDPLLINVMGRTALDEAVHKNRWDLVNDLALAMPVEAVKRALKNVQRPDVALVLHQCMEHEQDILRSAMGNVPLGKSVKRPRSRL